MLPPSKSEFDQHADGKNLEDQMHAKKTASVDHEDELADSETESDNDADADLDDDLGQEAETKPKKKGMGKGIIIAAAVGVAVAVGGVAYFMQGQPQKPTPVVKKIAVDPSLMEARPVLNSPTAPISSTEVTPNLSARDAAPVGPLSSSVSSISAPPSDPFSGSAMAPASPIVIAPIVAPTPTVITLPIVTPTPSAITPPMVTPTPSVIIAPAPTPAPAVIIISAPVNVESPRTDPFGAAVVKRSPANEKEAKPIAAPVVKAEKPIKKAKNKVATVDVEEVEIIKPRVVKKVIAKKPSVVRQDMTRSEPHPSQESVQPQSSENFSGYEKLF